MYVKYGFSSNPTPQFTLPVYSKSLLPAFKYVEKHYGFYTPKTQELMTELGGEFMMEDKVFQMLHCMFRTHLAQAPQRRRTLLLENPFFPSKLKNIITKVLFQRFQVSAVTFLPSQLMALMSMGESMGLVVDVGNLETTVLAVFDGRPLYSTSVTSPLAGKEVNIHLKKLLLGFATAKRSSRLVPPHPRIGARSAAPGLDDDVTLIPDMLTLQLLEEIKTRLLIVNKSRAAAPVSLSDPDLEERYSAIATASTIVFPFRFQGQGYDLTIPGWIREYTYDILFDTSEGLDCLTPPQAALECLRRVPTDLRASIISRLLLTGGTSASPNFSYRFQIELLDLLTQPRYASLRPLGDRLTLLNSIPTSGTFSSAHHAWAGAAVACGIRGVSEQVTADAFDPLVPVPDWITGSATSIVV
ncbi:hypothetical protein DSO57_1012908 [Entomophthora muscae]|uniref:Uncharacterized protein n=1 Tax=Entomophthora muscae TaxID=34485 RepID=A0ACC2SIM7_9FUNG|nr:hypothetical protein DSO57_1012908 [Entomophthora muscae]